ncbi:MAG TPA: sigma-70 family RNA polymerase sigma factor [Solirubrobacteraceae bacterium]|nr:sigma-70 family RNA polymerase sigma factor [Solirubrobacteraceae bacterium]
MSPLSVRRYRAERLLRKEFEAMRGRVLATVAARLRAAGVSLDPADLEACYAQAWHGLYTTMLEGRAEIANPAGWLTLVTYRRAIDEHRARTRAYDAHGSDVAAGSAVDGRAPERDLADELDDRARLRQLMEGLRGRLSPRERQAAALCYLQGLSRADAAARMGISETRMRKLMDGPRAGLPGVAGKVGELLNTIRAGSFCAEQSSLMRGLAYGILDPGGERYALAQAHHRECPACRAYVLSLRGLASVLPPLPLPLALGAGVAVGAGAGGAGAGASGAGAGAGAGTGATGGAVGVGAASGVAGAGGAAGGGWLVAGGGLGAKLAVGCLLAVSVGAGCVALSTGPLEPEHGAHRRRLAHTAGPRAASAAGAYQALSASLAGAQPVSGATSPSQARPSGSASTAGSSAPLTPAARASREFGLEQPPAGGSGAAPKPGVARAARFASIVRRSPGARSTAAGGPVGASTASAASFAGTAPTAAGPSSSGGGSSGGGSSGASPSPAEREFGIG